MGAPVHGLVTIDKGEMHLMLIGGRSECETRVLSVIHEQLLKHGHLHVELSNKELVHTKGGTIEPYVGLYLTFKEPSVEDSTPRRRSTIRSSR